MRRRCANARREQPYARWWCSCGGVGLACARLGVEKSGEEGRGVREGGRRARARREGLPAREGPTANRRRRAQRSAPGAPDSRTVESCQATKDKRNLLTNARGRKRQVCASPQPRHSHDNGARRAVRVAQRGRRESQTGDSTPPRIAADHRHVLYPQERRPPQGKAVRRPIALGRRNCPAICPLPLRAPWPGRDLPAGALGRAVHPPPSPQELGALPHWPSSPAESSPWWVIQRSVGHCRPPSAVSVRGEAAARSDTRAETAGAAGRGCYLTVRSLCCGLNFFN